MPARRCTGLACLTKLAALASRKCQWIQPAPRLPAPSVAAISSRPTEPRRSLDLLPFRTASFQPTLRYDPESNLTEILSRGCKILSVYPTWTPLSLTHSRRNATILPRVFHVFLFLCAIALTSAVPSLAQSGQPTNPPAAESTIHPAPINDACGLEAHPDQQLPGSITGTVADPTGTAVPGAHLSLVREDSPALEQLSADDGRFSFSSIAPGPFHLTVTADGFSPQTASGNLASGESCVMPRIVLAVATNITEVKVELSTIELAQEQIKDQEKQRLFGVIPNFYVTYVPDAAPLNPRQKFQLAWKSTIDPVSFGVTAVVAGVQQATDKFPGYGQGAEGYGRRYGAAYGDLVTGTFIGGAVLPSVLHQDPRYFYKGTGTVRSRVLYAIANSVICKGDNGHWQPNYSGIIGSLAAGAISNLYYPEGDRTDAALTFENALIGIGETAAVNILQEFVMRRFTPSAAKIDPPNSTP